MGVLILGATATWAGPRPGISHPKGDFLAEDVDHPQKIRGTGSAGTLLNGDYAPLDHLFKISEDTSITYEANSAKLSERSIIPVEISHSAKFELTYF
jgi:hypothetical protein